MRINITIEDGDEKPKDEPAPSATPEVQSTVGSAPADLAARAAALGASSGGSAPMSVPDTRGEPPPFVPEDPGGPSAPSVEPMATSNSTAVSSAGRAPFGPEPEAPVEVDEGDD